MTQTEQAIKTPKEFTKRVREFIILRTAVEGIDNLKEFLSEYGGYMSQALGLIDALAEQRKELITRVIETLDWMVKDLRWRFDDSKSNLEPGSRGGYSPELTEAIKLLEELKEIRGQKTEVRDVKYEQTRCLAAIVVKLDEIGNHLRQISRRIPVE